VGGGLRRAEAVLAIGLAGVLVAGTAWAGGSKGAGDIRLDQIQILATHNSYHLRPEPPFDFDPEVDYGHAPLDVQLEEQGVRSFELDTYNSPDLPVFHTLVIDTGTTCSTLTECLGAIRAWSKEHRGHVPIVVLIEPKDLPTNPDPGIQQAIDEAVADQGLSPWDAAGLDRLDDHVRSIFGRSLVTPDEVRGRSRTLRAAIRKRGWPTLEEARGGVIVVLNSSGVARDLFLASTPTLEGRAMFVTSRLELPSAAILKRDAPDEAEIAALVRDHFLVRTRADADTTEARANDLSRATRALASGAQIVSTDYPVADPLIGPYLVDLPGEEAVRCNPVTAPRRCRDAALER
jgi:hypothetical protein